MRRTGSASPADSVESSPPGEALDARSDDAALHPGQHTRRAGARGVRLAHAAGRARAARPAMGAGPRRRARGWGGGRGPGRARDPGGPLRIRWVARHRDFEDGREFADEQVEGPFAAWRHVHRVLPDGGDRCVLADRVEYRLPCGTLGSLVGGRRASACSSRLFRFRHGRARHDLRATRVAPPARADRDHGRHGPRGRSAGRLPHGRRPPRRRWCRRPARPARRDRVGPARDRIDAAALEGVDAVIHLAGESIAAGRWNAARKDAIRRSRVDSTPRPSRGPRRAPRGPRRSWSPPRRSATTATAATTLLTETSRGGLRGFWPRSCQAWEDAAAPALEAGIRVVAPRIGMVLAAAGGALGKMLPPARLGLGGPMGDGRLRAAGSPSTTWWGRALRFFAPGLVARPAARRRPVGRCDARAGDDPRPVLRRPRSLPLSRASRLPPVRRDGTGRRAAGDSASCPRGFEAAAFAGPAPRARRRAPARAGRPPPNPSDVRGASGGTGR